MKKTPMKLLQTILVISLIGTFLLPHSAKANDSVKSGGNEMGIEFAEDYVPKQTKPEPEPEPTPIEKSPEKKNVLPQTGEAPTNSSLMRGLLLIIGLVIVRQQRRKQNEI